MKFAMKTVVLQEMIGRAIKGASQNKLIPLTSLICIQLKDKKLSLITTNASDYLYVQKNDVEGDDFYIVLQVSQFQKLISKMTSENTTLELKDGNLVVKGNGTYKLEIPLDENGQPIVFPDPVADLKFNGEPTSQINLATIQTILSSNKAALAQTMEEPVFTNYYVGEKVISTDTYKMCALDAKLWEEPALISPETMNLLGVMTQEKIDVDFIDNNILFTTENCLIYSHLMDGIEDFPCDLINNVFEEVFSSNCKLDKGSLLAALDRILLFVAPYDDNYPVVLTFGEKELSISSNKSDGVEILPYLEIKDFKPYRCPINILTLIQQLKATQSTKTEIHFGNENFLKIVDGNVTQILALLDEEGLEI